MPVRGNQRYRDAQFEELQYAACSGAKHDAESSLQSSCRLEPRAGEFIVADVARVTCAR